MLTRLSRTTALTALATLPAAASTAAGGERVERRLAAMGTSLVLEVDAADRPTALAASEAAVRALEVVEARLSTWRAESELSRLNGAPVGELVTLDSALADDLALARRWWAATKGAFDPGVGALVDAWGLREGGRIPSTAELADARAASGLRLLELRGRTAVRRHAGLRLEEGGFGKGVGLDAALAALARSGARAARVELGGQVAVLGDPVRLAVAHPRERERSLAALELPGGSLATSGNSERGVVVDGRPVGHLIDPRTGEPAPDFGSLTVWAEDAATADCLSTALFVMGAADALRWASERPGVEALALELLPGGAVRARATAGLHHLLQPLEDGLTIELVPAPGGNDSSHSERPDDPQ